MSHKVPDIGHPVPRLAIGACRRLPGWKPVSNPEQNSQNESSNITQSLKALPMYGSNSSDDESQTINVGGEPIKLDKLGPIVINSDGINQSVDSHLNTQ